MKKRWIRALAGTLCAGVLLLGAAGCKNGRTASSAVEDDDLVYSVPPLVDIDITTLLTLEQVSEALGAQVDEPSVYEDGTWVHYAAQDIQKTVDIHIINSSREGFDAQADVMKEAYPGKCVDAPNLGETAFYNRETRELMAYGKGYMLDIVIGLQANEQDDRQMQAARNLAALILEKL